MTQQLKKIKYEVLFEALQGEIFCGDQYFIKECPDCILLAVVDGLGHGEDAAFAAKKVLQILDVNANESIETLFKLCNEALVNTRGAAITIAQIDDKHKLSYMAIGNVRGVCWKLDNNAQLKQESILLQGGIVGAHREPPTTLIKEIAMGPGDIFILATDGIKAEFESEAPKLATPEKIAKQIFTDYRNLKDDGLILVAQLL